MAVRIKMSAQAQGYDIMSLASRLSKVKEAIKLLPLNQGETEMPADEVKPEVAKGPRKKVAEKKVKAEKPASNLVKLSELCEEIGLTSTKGRRVLRGTEGLEDPGSRWAWEKSSPQLKLVKEALKEAVKDSKD